MATTAQESQLLVLEDDSATSKRRHLAAIGGKLNKHVTVRLHEIRAGYHRVLAEESYKSGVMQKQGRSARAALALRLLDKALPAFDGVLVAGSSYGSNGEFLAGVRSRGLTCIAEVRASELLEISSGLRVPANHLSRQKVELLLQSANWRHVQLEAPATGRVLTFSAAYLSGVAPHRDLHGQLFAAQTGAIPGVHRGTIIGFAPEGHWRLEDLVRSIAWVRWIRPALRRTSREGQLVTRATPAITMKQAKIAVRANIALAERQDDRLQELDAAEPRLRGVLGGERNLLNVVELFAGAGGMGLGFLLASAKGGYRVIYSGEVNPIYAATLRQNHARVAETRRNAQCVPCETEPIDLRSSDALAHVSNRVRRAGGVDILIGGPPCQGFSNANRNSWSRSNPNNKLVDVFVTYVEALLPRIFVMENVQGILWTSKAGSSGRMSVVDHVATRMKRAGYSVFPRLLDAVWYGVPQYRSRFFLIGIHRDLGYREDDFGAWGPFPRPTHGLAAGQPYVTVRDAILDLPQLENGEGCDEAEYAGLNSDVRRHNPFLMYARQGCPRGLIHDHVTSRHADYVIERYRRIPPGGNWESIVDTMSNYADVSRTHSNIYRRLTWDQPAITIGHYRKSMLVHPGQHRGLSLREASRLQSFPDWFRFAGRADGGEGGLVHKQQQLANAVCPLVAKAIADFLVRI